MSGSAYAQTWRAQCGTPERVKAVIGKVHAGLVRKHWGIDAAGNYLEIYVTPEGEWVSLMYMPDKRACITGTGHEWTEDDTPLAKGA